MLTTTTIVQSLILYTISWTCWRIFRRSFFKIDLDNIAGPPSDSYILGNLGNLFSPNGWEFHQNMSEQFGRVIRIYGLFHMKHLYIFDPKALSHIFMKDLDIFEETTSFIESNRLIFGEGLLSTIGQVHRKQRKMLNPIFSASRVREMAPMMYTVANNLRDGIQQCLADGPQEIDLLQWTSRASLELIGQCGLGCSFDPLVKEAAHPYTRSVSQLALTVLALIIPRTFLLTTLVKIGSPRFRRFFVDLMPWSSVRKLRDIVDMMDKTSVEIFERKKKAAVSKQLSQGKDLMSILMRANMEAPEDDRLPEKEVLGQISTLVFAATDTTSNALARILHLLTIHQEVQERLRQEITDARKKDGDLPHDRLTSLPLLDAICRESLRLYPPVPFLTRIARADAVLPLTTPIKGIDGRVMDTISIPKGTEVFTSILSANRDTTLWGPDALEWKPERWLSPLPQAVLDARIPGVYSHIMTFLGGGRSCIGFNFSQMEIKVVLSVLISRFRFLPPKKEIIWETGLLVTPAVKDQPGQPQMPLTVQLIEPAV